MEKRIAVPKRIQLETFYGCNARCVMCAMSFTPVRKKEMMPVEMSEYVLTELSPFVDQIEKVDLFGLGEPLLDPFLFDRIESAKRKGFRNIAVSTNADLLNRDKQKRLLGTGIDSILLSIDGVLKETHENIRIGVDFERVLENCLSLIEMRDREKCRTRFVVRLIKQKSNQEEWEPYKRFWQDKLSADKDDLLILYGMNTMGGYVYSKKDLVHTVNEKIEKAPCHMVFDRFIVLNDGTVPLCCEDTPRADFAVGNVNSNTPIDIFNNKKMNRMRDLHLKERKNDIEICRNCTVLYSEKDKVTINL